MCALPLLSTTPFFHAALFFPVSARLLCIDSPRSEFLRPHKEDYVPRNYAKFDFDVSSLVRYLNFLQGYTTLSLTWAWITENLVWWRVLLPYEIPTQLNHEIIPSYSIELISISQQVDGKLDYRVGYRISFHSEFTEFSRLLLAAFIH